MSKVILVNPFEIPRGEEGTIVQSPHDTACFARVDVMGRGINTPI